MAQGLAVYVRGEGAVPPDFEYFAGDFSHLTADWSPLKVSRWSKSS